MAEDNNNLLFSDDVLSEVEASSLGGVAEGKRVEEKIVTEPYASE